jgi:hypothetical protein
MTHTSLLPTRFCQDLDQSEISPLKTMEIFLIQPFARAKDWV